MEEGTAHCDFTYVFQLSQPIDRADKRVHSCKASWNRHPPPTGKRNQFVTPDTNEEDEENDPMSEHSDSESLEGENEQSLGNPGDVIVGQSLRWLSTWKILHKV